MSDNDMRIIPERDEIRARPKSSNKSTATDSSRRAKKTSSTPKSTGGGVSFFSVVLSLFFVLLTGFSAYLYLQSQELASERDILAARVLDIESKLSFTDESLSQSGAAIQAALKEQEAELETHMAEIRKLWAVAYDRNRVAIEGLQSDQKDTSARMNSLSGSVAKLDPILKGYDGIQSRLETMSSQLLVQSATVDDLSMGVRQLSDQIGIIEKNDSSHSSMLSEHQEAIDAIDQYRLQINQRLIRLEQSMSVTPNN